MACYERTIDLHQELADRFNEATTLDKLGQAHHSAGHVDAARRTWTRALHILTEIGHPDGDRVRARLGQTPCVSLVAGLPQELDLQPLPVA